ncbi:kinase-like domain-containing protein [Flagelloscypha sp. PMI_526]|nr:kinase-like domain-containing protein [Flagelloscypha sp. PMI_526]
MNAFPVIAEWLGQHTAVLGNQILSPSTITMIYTSFPLITAGILSTGLPVFCRMLSRRGQAHLNQMLPSAAGSFLLLIQHTLHCRSWDSHSRRALLHLVQNIVVAHSILPTSFELHDVTANAVPFNGGGYGDVYQGVLQNEHSVCVKVLRIYSNPEKQDKSEQDKQKVLKAFLREAVLWHQLDHPNILPFLGVSYDCFPNRLSLISPFMKNGNIMDYLKEHPEPSEQRMELLYQIVQGINYLHEMDICHGDIKGVNILMDDQHKPRIADMGITSIVSSQSETLQWGMTSSQSPIGSVRWSAPEIFLPHEFRSSTPSHSSTTRDVYAFGCTMLEVLTGRVPFSEVDTDPAVLLKLIMGSRPNRPDASLVSDAAWRIIQQCWAQEPSKRVSIFDVLLLLQGGALSVASTSALDASGQNSQEKASSKGLFAQSFPRASSSIRKIRKKDKVGCQTLPGI